MKRLVCCFILFFTVLAIHAQRVYFVYLQSETEQPFSVKMDDRIYNSSGPGYLILSKLHDSSYRFTVVFPQNKWPEQQFAVDMLGKDHGFLLKNFGEKGWGLFDLQTLSVQMAVAPSAKASTEPVEVSAFTDILSRAANDPSLKEKPVVVKQQDQPVVPQAAVAKEQVKEKEVVKAVSEPEKKEPAVVVATEKEQPLAEVLKKPDTLAKKTEPVIAEKPKEVVESVAKKDPPTRPTEEEVVKQDIAKAEPVLKKDDTPVKPREEAPARQETVKKEEPAAETLVKKEEEVAPSEYKPSTVRRKSESSTTEGFGLTFVDEYADGKKDTIRIVIPPSRFTNTVARESKDDRKFLDITSDTKEASTVQKPAEAKKNAGPKCMAADDNDFLKLRKRMAGQNKDEGMVSEAAKYFKSKCFSVVQIKNLSALFLNDAAKFKFFDAASGHVTDADNFASLQSELKEQVYIDRFKSIHP